MNLALLRSPYTAVAGTVEEHLIQEEVDLHVGVEDKTAEVNTVMLVEQTDQITKVIEETVVQVETEADRLKEGNNHKEVDHQATQLDHQATYMAIPGKYIYLVKLIYIYHL